jgi:adenylate kinase family enzyme
MGVRVHILGASGSGTTTLASGISNTLKIESFDADHYFWEQTDPPFTTKRGSEERLALLKKDLDQNSSWVLSGSIVNWADTVKDRFTHVIFIFLPQATRLSRLRERERQRFGTRIDDGGDMYQQHIDFIDWAKKYDEGGLEVRSQTLHEDWLKSLTCPILKISGELSREAQIQKAVQWMEIGEQ